MKKIVVFFSSPPADSAVNQIKRSVSFAQNTLVDTVTSALKEKYGAPTTETYWMFWNYSGNGNESKMCHMAHRMGSNERASFYNPSCNGLELIAFVDTRKEVLGGLTTVLVDHNEITRQVSATHGYRAQLKEERHQKEKKNASENSAPIL